MTNTERIKQKALELGFELIGIAPADPTPDFGFFLDWLDRGYAGTMEYLRRGAERRRDLGQILPGVRSIICCGLNYNTGLPSGPIARYVQGEDYHKIVGEKLALIEEYIKEVIDPAAGTKSYVDTGPILERSYAALAGLGWIGKNSCLINNGVGSYVFLGEILTTLDLEHDRPTFDQCGSCRRCIESCPTDALREPGLLDSNRCIAYLTIEYKGDFSAKQAAMVGDHLFGCDICQEVCPYNERIPITAEKRLFPREGVREGKTKPSERINERQWRRNLQAVSDNGSRRTSRRSA